MVVVLMNESRMRGACQVGDQTGKVSVLPSGVIVERLIPVNLT